MITPDEALSLVIQNTAALQAVACPLSDACGRVLAEDVVANRDCPPFPRAMMDGFAVRLADAGKSVPIAGEIPAGTTWDGTLADGSCLAILTGAPCPQGTEAVVAKEKIQLQGSSVLLPMPIKRSQNIAAPGSECQKGESVVPAGTRLTPLGVAALASFGRTTVRIIPRPCVSIITTGGELAALDGALQPGQICDSNGPMLAAMAMQLGLATPRCLHARDNLAELRQALEMCADTDIVVLTGGVSVGTYDLVPLALAEIGAEAIFHGVRQKPGKPLLFARTARQLFFGLPGNPLSSHFGFHRYVSAAVRKMSGLEGKPRILQGDLTAPIDNKGDRTSFVPARAEPLLPSPSAWRVTPLPTVSSADVFHTSLADCYMEAPPNRLLAAGKTCVFTMLNSPL